MTSNGSKADIVAEIHRLIDEQFAALKDKFSTDEALEYSERARRISELLDVIAKPNHQRGKRSPR